MYIYILKKEEEEDNSVKPGNSNMCTYMHYAWHMAVTFPTTRVGYIDTTREEKNIFLFSLDDNTANKVDKVQGRIFFFFFFFFFLVCAQQERLYSIKQIVQKRHGKGLEFSFM
jgi:hypothetical protein